MLGSPEPLSGATAQQCPREKTGFQWDGELALVARIWLESPTRSKCPKEERKYLVPFYQPRESRTKCNSHGWEDTAPGSVGRVPPPQCPSSASTWGTVTCKQGVGEDGMSNCRAPYPIPVPSDVLSPRRFPSCPSHADAHGLGPQAQPSSKEMSWCFLQLENQPQAYEETSSQAPESKGQQSFPVTQTSS